MPPIHLIGNPANRRIAYFQQALSSRGLPPAIVHSYQDVISSSRSLEEILVPGSIIRIDSPGEDFEVEKLLLKEGAQAASQEGSPYLEVGRIDQLENDRGLILNPRQWYLGFRKVLQRWEDQLNRIPDIRCVTPPSNILVMFDKRLCHARCQSAQVPVPASWGPIHSYDDFIRIANERSANRAFIKLAHGSSASGVIAWRRQDTRQVAITSAEIVRGQHFKLYNSLKIRRYTNGSDIADLINVLARNHVHVEDWFPKASVESGLCFDLRVVTIAGEPCHTVVRQSANPMTNLHLGNKRGRIELVHQRLGPGQILEIQETSRRTANLFPKSLMSGLDIAISPNFSKHVVLEANAFGDLLPNILHQGVDTYTAQVDAIVNMTARDPS